MLLDEYIWADDITLRNIIFVLLGILLMTVTGVDTPISNMSLERWWFDDEQETGEDMQHPLLEGDATDV